MDVRYPIYLYVLTTLMTWFPTLEPTKAKPKRKTADKLPDKDSFATRVGSLWKVGAHVSCAKGVENSVMNAAAIGCVLYCCLISSEQIKVARTPSRSSSSHSESGPPHR